MLRFVVFWLVVLRFVVPSLRVGLFCIVSRFVASLFVVLMLFVSFVAFRSMILARLVVFRFGCLLLSKFGLGLVVSFCLGQALVRLVCFGWARLGLGRVVRVGLGWLCVG